MKVVTEPHPALAAIVGAKAPSHSSHSPHNIQGDVVLLGCCFAKANYVSFINTFHFLKTYWSIPFFASTPWCGE